MRAIVLSVFALSIASIANAQEINQTAAPTAENQSIAIAGQCVDVRDGLQPVGGNTRAPLVLWNCHGRDNQIAHLENGALLFGSERAFFVRPMYAPSRGCRDIDYNAGGIHYIYRACAGRGAFSVNRSTPGTVIYRFYARGGRFAVTRGAPVIAQRIERGVTRFNRFALNDEKLSVTGADLCVTPASNATEGAPLYLDLCDAPEQADGANTADGAGRETVTFRTVAAQP